MSVSETLDHVTKSVTMTTSLLLKLGVCMACMAASLTVAVAEGYAKPVRYAGPIVYSGDKPPIVHFPKPSRPQSGYGGYRGRQRKAPTSIKYVPLPHHDLPVLIYQSDSQPPIHVVHTPAPHVAPKPVSSGYSAPKPASSGYSAPKPVAKGYNAPKTVSSGYNAPKPVSSGYSATKSISAGYSAPEPASLGYSAPRSVGSVQYGASSNSRSDSLANFLPGNDINLNVDTTAVVTRRSGDRQKVGAVRRDGSSGGHHGQGHGSVGHQQNHPQSQRNPGHQSSGHANSGHQAANQVNSGYQVPSQVSTGYPSFSQTNSGYRESAQVAESDENAVYIRSPPAPALVYVNAPQPIYVSSQPKLKYKAPQKAVPQSSYGLPKGSQSVKKQKPLASYSVPPSNSYKTPSKGKENKAVSKYPTAVTSSYKGSPVSKGTSKPQVQYKAPATSPSPHIIYAGHPPIHVYQQPQVKQVPHTPTKAYGPPPAQKYTSQPPKQSYGAPSAKPQSYKAPKPPSYTPPVTNQYKAPTKSKPTGKYPAAVSNSYGPPHKNNEVKSKGYGKRPSKLRAQTKPAPVYLPAPKSYNKPPIIIYQGVRPPVHVYKANTAQQKRPNLSYSAAASPAINTGYNAPKQQPSSGYSAPQRRIDSNTHTNSFTSIEPHLVTQRLVESESQVVSSTAIEPRFSTQRRGSVHTVDPSADLSGSEGWRPLGVAQSEMVPAAAYIMAAPDLSREASKTTQVKNA